MMLLLILALAAFALSYLGSRSPGEFVHALSAGPKDGNWTAIAIDGQRIGAERFRLVIRDGKVVGGRDDCNDWGYASEPDANGERSIISTLQACPDTDIRRRFQAIIASPTLDLTSDGRLRASGSGHSSVLVRCRWRNVHSTLPGGGTSDMARCMPDE
ncbi:MAG: hypothetical protein ACM3ZV_06235 [Bacillota bacterium]